MNLPVLTHSNYHVSGNSVILVCTCIIKYQKWKSLESRNSTPGGDGDMRPLSLLRKI